MLDRTQGNRWWRSTIGDVGLGFRMILGSTCVVLLICLSGCRLLKIEPLHRTADRPQFREMYQRLKTLPECQAGKVNGGPLVTLTTQQMPLEGVLRELSDQTKVSIVAEAGLDQSPVTLDVIDVPVDEVLGVIARRLGVQVTRTGSIYFLGSLRPEDKGVLVRRVRRLSANELSDSVSVLLSQNGSVRAHEDGLVIVGDRVEVLARVVELLDRIERADTSSWVVQLHLVQLSDRALADWGLDVEPAADIGLAFASASSSLQSLTTAAT